MYHTPDGKDVLVVDSHTHYWDASPDNWRNKFGEGWIKCFYDYSRNLSPAEYVWSLEKFEKYDPDVMAYDLFVKGHVDIACLQSTYLKEFYTEGFNTIEQNGVMKKKYPDRFILNGRWDPREGAPGMDELRRQKDEWNITGVKLYTAEWLGESKGWKVNDPEAMRYLELCAELGIKNIHLHKGPTVYPLNRDAFDVSDVDDAATSFPELNFIIDHIGLPRLDDFCWIATQESNVYGGLAVAMPFIHGRPRYFAEMMANLLYWIGPDRILFGSDYAIWEPGWLIEKFWSFELPEDIKAEFGVNLDEEAKRKILGLNAARLYGINPEEHLPKIQGDELAQKAQQVLDPQAKKGDTMAATSVDLKD